MKSKSIVCNSDTMLGLAAWTLITLLFYIYISAILLVYLSSYITLND